MNKCFFFFFIYILSFFHINADQNEFDEIVRNVQFKTGKILEKRHHLHLSGIGIQNRNGIKVLELMFQKYDIFSKEQIRNLLLDSVKEFLLQINSDLNLKPFLKKYPYDHTDVEIVVFITNRDDDVNHPDICLAEVSKGKLIYITEDEHTRHSGNYKSEAFETYEEAVCLSKEWTAS